MPSSFNSSSKKAFKSSIFSKMTSMTMSVSPLVLYTTWVSGCPARCWAIATSLVGSTRSPTKAFITLPSLW